MASSEGRELGQVIADSIRARRAAARLSQESVAARMRALGFSEWTRQTVGSTEKPTRRVTAAEAIGLSLVFGISLPGLFRPDGEPGDAVQFPGGAVAVKSLERLVGGLNDGSVTWEKDKPVFKPGKAAWMADDPDAPVPDAVRAAWAAAGDED